jgi:hypothetical protein
MRRPDLEMASVRRCLLCAALPLALLGCGGGTASTSTTASTNPTTTTTTTPASASPTAAWARQTQQLCREKRAAIASLGDVHITYGGIAREGLPAVKRLLERYLSRLLAVLHDFSRRQRELATPPPLTATMAFANRVDVQSQSATVRLRREVARATTPAQFSAAFSGWVATEQRLAARGDAVAQRLGLASCRSGVATPSP